MSIRLYNSLTRRTEELVPIHEGKLNMFVCGPTVYDRVHLGNARTFTIFDVVAKWLRYRGFDVNYIQNITDIDDKIIRRATEAGQDPLAFAHQYDNLFRADMQALGNTAVSQYLRATDYIPQVIAQVKTLRDKGHVYLIEQDGWYYDLSTFPDYGKLSGRTGLTAQDAVSRIDDSDKKRNSGDFCVWKLSKQGEPVWEDSELGDGRPGWHIEDTAITEAVFGPQYDIHGGGMDLKFPHHEAEIAQQEAASDLVPFVKYWMHAGFLENKSEKMSKSLGNFMTLRDALERWQPEVLRYFFLSAHYTAPLEFSEQSIHQAASAIANIRNTWYRMQIFASSKATEKPTALHDRVANYWERFTEALDNDFNTPQAFGILSELLNDINKNIDTEEASRPDISHAEALVHEYQTILGIIPDTELDIPAEVLAKVQEREAARRAQDWASADAARTATGALGYTIDDTPYGPLVKKA